MANVANDGSHLFNALNMNPCDILFYHLHLKNKDGVTIKK